MHLLIIGGSDAGISAALRAQELDPGAEVTMALADDFPNFSICGLPYYLSGETPDWRNLAHRTEFPDINVLRQHTAESIDVARKSVAIRNAAGEKTIRYDRWSSQPGRRRYARTFRAARWKGSSCFTRWTTVSLCNAI